MTPQDELTLLEGAYSSILTGKVQSYTIGSRMVNKLNLQVIIDRMDILRAQIQRQTSGMSFVSQFRRPE